MSSVQAESAKPFIPFVARLYAPLEPYAYALIRVTAGAIFVPHGIQKLFGGGAPALAAKTLAAWGLPAPLAWAYGLGVLELVGGALLAVGFLTRPIALLFIIELAVFIFGVHIDRGWLWTRGGVQYPLFLLGLCVAVLLRGGGRYSIDYRIGKEF
jgi:putative oxidoreductase